MIKVATVHWLNTGYVFNPNRVFGGGNLNPLNSLFIPG